MTAIIKLDTSACILSHYPILVPFGGWVKRGCGNVGKTRITLHLCDRKMLLKRHPIGCHARQALFPEPDRIAMPQQQRELSELLRLRWQVVPGGSVK